MTDKKFLAPVVAALLVAAGLFFLGVFIKAGIDNIAFRDRQVTVRGLAEREVPANLVNWPITYSVAGNDLISLYDKVTANNGTIAKFLTDNGIAKDEISFGAPSLYNASTNQWASGTFQYKYSLECTVSVTSNKVDQVRKLINRQSELLKMGIPCSNSYISYQYTALNDIKPEMIAQATRNAREAADQFAADSDSKIGKMKTASQGQFTIEDASDATRWIKKVRVVSTIVYYLED